MSNEIWTSNRLLHGLACAAVHPGLRAILLLNAGPEQVLWCAEILAQMIGEVTENKKVLRTTLSSNVDEDGLWGIPFLPTSNDKSSFVWHGCMTQGYRQDLPQLLTIPNLAQLSIPVERAAIMATDTPVIHLERHGQHSDWSPRQWWLAGCMESEIGQISRHLLDRFFLRIPLGNMPSQSEESEHRIRHLQTALTKDSKNIPPSRLLTDAMRQNLQEAWRSTPHLTDGALGQISRFISINDGYSVRRDIGLARLAEAVAMLATLSVVTRIEVEVAATKIMGFDTLDNAAPEPPNHPNKEPTPVIEDVDPLPDRPDSPAPVSPQPQPDISRQGEDSPIKNTREQQFVPVMPSLGTAKNPYPEDEAPSERESAPLQMPMQRATRSRAFRGIPVGVEPATDLHDIALVATIFESIKYQPLLHQQFPHAPSTGLILHRDHLRRYRRLPAPEMLLVLVIDYTALRDNAWQEELVPHLAWAYTGRAKIALIRVGAQNAENELRADCIVGRSLLDPQILDNLVAEPGRASPLAHGLELAHQTLRHALQHGRSTIAFARLVIITDGRGNVPLAASQNRRLKLPINLQGIEDALQVAKELSQLERTEIICLDLAPPLHSKLLHQLAKQLGVTEQPLLHKRAADE